VVTYCGAVREMLAPHGVEARIFSTHSSGWRALWRAVREADLVHLNSNHLRLVLFARLLGKPVLIKYHYPFWDESVVAPHTPMTLGRRFARDLAFVWRHTASDEFAGKRVRHLAARFVRALARLVVAGAVDHRLACSEFIARSTDLPWDVELDYNPARFPAEPPVARGVAGEAPVFFFAGRLDAHKGADLLFTATALLWRRGRRLRVVLAGSGPAEAQLRAQATELGVAGDVEFLGAVPTARVRELMAAARAVVVPSRVNDPAPIVVLEAAAAGVACIGADAGGIPELIGAEGLLFPADDADALSQHMERVLDAPDEAATRGRAAWARLRERCDYAVAAPRLLAIYGRWLPGAAKLAAKERGL
jgi:glycosyltransferase involved in cell wall biosynthesis